MTFADDGDPPHADLTSRQAAIVRFCQDYRERKGYPPTFLEIGAAVGLKSAASVSYQVKQLRRKGYLDFDPGRPRTTTPRARLRTAASQASPGPGIERTAQVQVIGRIAAGGPITAMDLDGEYVYVDPSLIRAHEHFALEVVGDSMIGKAIIDGDRVVIRTGDDVSNGDIVVARFPSEASSEGEATLKTYKQVGGHIWLLPENPAYEPFIGDEAEILGKVVHVDRTLR